MGTPREVKLQKMLSNVIGGSASSMKNCRITLVPSIAVNIPFKVVTEAGTAKERAKVYEQKNIKAIV